MASTAPGRIRCGLPQGNDEAGLSPVTTNHRFTGYNIAARVLGGKDNQISLLRQTRSNYGANGNVATAVTLLYWSHDHLTAIST